jgi:hypothetical protein
MLPNVELAQCVAGNQTYKLHIYWMSPERMSKNSYLEQDAIIVVASALNKSLKTLPRRSSKLDSPESFLVSKEVLHASRFELKEETKDSTQKAFPNRFSNAATTLLLQGMESEFLKISSHGDFSPRQQHLALELHNNATYSLSVAGTKHTMTVETFTRESIRERLEALRRKDPEWVQWSENRYLRLCLKNAQETTKSLPRSGAGQGKVGAYPPDVCGHWDHFSLKVRRVFPNRTIHQCGERYVQIVYRG